MNISKKQISLGALATLAVIATPIATVISCGEDVNDLNIIDLNEIKSPKELIAKINAKLNNVMPEKATMLADAKTATNGGAEKIFNKIANYVNKIKSDTDKIILKFNGSEVIWDLSGLNQTIKDVQKSISLGYSKIVPQKSMGDLAKLENPSMAVYPIAQSKDDLGRTMTGMGLMAFSNMPPNGFASYNKMLNEYHKLAFQFINTKTYKEWIKGKTFELASDIDTMKNTSNIEKVQPGQKYDDNSFRKMPLTPLQKSKEYTQEGNNFEAQWVLSIMKFQ